MQELLLDKELYEVCFTKEMLIQIGGEQCYCVVIRLTQCSVADPGGPKGSCPPPPGPVNISHKKDLRQRRPHRFHVSCPPPPLPGRH